MILSDTDIKSALNSGRIKIFPLPDFKEQLGSCSIDLHLGNEFRVFDRSKCPYIDTRQTQSYDKIMKQVIALPGQSFIMQSKDFVLASTIETLELADDIVARIEGRSSLGRLGIIVHGTASIFDPGWQGKVVMELGNLGPMPVALYPGMRICAFTFEELSSPAEVPYQDKPGQKYAGQEGPVASKLGED